VPAIVTIISKGTSSCNFHDGAQARQTLNEPILLGAPGGEGALR
jgi:hypothetical protein